MAQVKITTKHGYEVALEDDELSAGKLKRIALDILDELGAAPDRPIGFEGVTIDDSTYGNPPNALGIRRG